MNFNKYETYELLNRNNTRKNALKQVTDLTLGLIEDDFFFKIHISINFELILIFNFNIYQFNFVQPLFTT